MKISEKGFTLLELMIVVAIITILSTMTLPSYQDRIIRAQIKEGINLAEFIKKDVEDYYRDRGVFPEDNAAAGLPAPDKIIGNYVKNITVQKGVIRIMFGNNANVNIVEKTLVIRPAIVQGTPKIPVAWVHGYAKKPQGMTVSGINNTGILQRLLPVKCRL